jgi:Flp pilus assembly protein TadD
MFLLRAAILSLEMLDDAALALEEIEPEDKTRTEVLGARIALYITAKKWDMAAAVASHLVKVEPENEAWWINLAYSVRRSEGIEQAENILLRARAIHPKVAMIAFNLACYASVTGRMEDATERLRNAMGLDCWLPSTPESNAAPERGRAGERKLSASRGPTFKRETGHTPAQKSQR